MMQKSPPKIIKGMISLLIRSGNRSTLLGDLEEEYQYLYTERGKYKANSWYLKQLIIPLIDFIRASIFWRTVMFRNYLKIALRNIARHKAYSSINIGGLGVGLAGCILILLWVQDEVSYDGFHNNADSIYRVVLGDPKIGYNQYAAVTPVPLAPAAKEEIPEVIWAVRMVSRSTLLEYNTKRFDEKGLMVSQDFFQMFSFQLVKGNLQTALNDPFSIIITQSLAQKYFGDEDPIGKTFRENNVADFQITGVLKDIVDQSHLQFDFLMPFHLLENMGSNINNWDNISYYTYVQLRDGSDLNTVTQKMTQCVQSHFTRGELTCMLQPLKKIYLDKPGLFDISEHGNRQSLIIFIAAALFILIIACMNFMNLKTARSCTRATEVGLRKVVGADRWSLIRQFYSESFILTLLALLFAIVLVLLFLPAFNTLAQKNLSLSVFKNINLLLGLVGITFFTSLVAGSYPALFLSAFQPISIIRGFTRSKRGALLRKFLVISQFSLTAIVLIGMMVVRFQLNFLLNKDLGYDKEHLLSLRLRGDIRRQIETIKQELIQHPNILSVSATGELPTQLSSGGIAEWEGKSPDSEIHFKILWTDPDYLSTFKMTMSEGRFFSESLSNDKNNFVLNESAIRAMGIESPIGKQMSARGVEGTIIGVVNDFHFRSLHHSIEPLILINRPERFFRLCIRIDPENGDLHGLLGDLENLWNRFSPEFPFEYQFLDDRIATLYRSELQTQKLFQYFAWLTLIIACLGLFGLASFMAEQRTKEIGIRKVLGASLSGIIFLLTKNFAKWVLISNVIAWPAAYFFFNKWLQGFAYRTEIPLVTFLIAGGTTLIVALVTVSYQSLKAALIDPVKSLKVE